MRDRLLGRIGSTLVVALSLACLGTAGDAAAAPGPARYVNPFAGTARGAPDFGTGGGAGNTFPGPVMPFGMIQWGPDTTPATQNVGGGYAYGDSRIRGFSVRRLSGAGCANGGDLPLLPTTEPITASPVLPDSTEFRHAFTPSFAHSAEEASAGYYRVALDPETPRRIGAKLTATTRTGAARFTYPPHRPARVLLNVTGSRTGNSAGDVQIDPAAGEISGSAESGGFCHQPNRYRIYFVARFDRPFSDYGTWTGSSLAPGSTSAEDSGPTAQTGAYVGFGTRAQHPVGMRIGISFVSVEGARENLDAETAGAGFDALRERARAAWDRILGRIHVSGGRVADLRSFYSMLYRALVSPSTFSDVDGRYMGMDGEIHDARGYTQYADFSGWDVYRSQMPLLALIDPQRASEIVSSLLADARESGWLPKWSVANGQTGTMAGDSADPAIASIWALGGRDFDLGAALAAMVHGATAPGTSSNAGYVERPGIEEYVRLGYVPHELNTGGDQPRADLAWGSAGTTLEYALDDFAIARLAAAAGENATCQQFLARSGNWRNVFDPAIGFPRPRWSDGSFIEPYDPTAYDPSGIGGFAEGSGAQYTWMVPQDPAGLFEALGGRRAARERLDRFFSELNAGAASGHAFLGNEPNSNAPWLYDWLGQPYKAQRIVRHAILGLFSAAPGGYPGNDDLGQMSAWYVFGALGLYPAVPGTDILALGSPLFARTTIHRPGGDLSLVAPAAGPRAPYVHGLRVGGHPHPSPWLPLASVSDGARLRFDLGGKPDLRWGTGRAAAPPSFGPADPTACG